MNKLSKILLIFVVALSSCNPMNDTYNLLNKNVQPPQAKFSYTLTKADYTTIGDMAMKDATNHADTVMANTIKSSQYLFGNYDNTYIPKFLASSYPGLGNESSVHVTYNYYNGPLTSATMYELAGQYTLSDADYQSMGGAVSIYKYFSPSNPATDYVPDFFSTKYPSDTNGTVRLVKYKFADSDPAGGEIAIFDQEFAIDNSLGNFTATSVTGDQTWDASSYGAKMTGYVSSTKTHYANEDWLVSPAIDLTGFTSPSFQVSQTINYWDKTLYPNQIQILVSTDYLGDVTTATWTPLTINTMPSGTSWTEVPSEKVDLSAYAGKKIYVAFKYVSTTTEGATWEIDWMKVYGTIPVSGSGVAPTVLNGGAFYKLSGNTWKVASGVYYLSSADYNSMGAPGKYDNFSSSENPDNYLPQFLSQKYPYAQEGDQMDVAYKYYSSGLHLYVDQYTFTNSIWTKYDPVATVTSPFVNKEGVWAFDPTVKFTMVSADYQIIVNAVYADPATKSLVDPKYKDVEYYYGADAYFKDFNAQISYRTSGQYAQSDYTGLSDAAATTLIMKRIQDGLAVMLKAKFPNAVTQVGGIDVMYVITYNIFPNSGGTAITYTSTFQCTKSGPNPEFTLVDNPAPSK